jgi:hypothetical protein
MWWWLGCVVGAEEWAARARAATDPAAAQAAWGEACNLGRIEACDAAGAIDLPGPERDRWNERACAHGLVAACLRRSVTPGDEFALRACALGDGAACAGAGRPAEACAKGLTPSCLAAGDLARAAGDREQAAKLYDARCAAHPGDVSCLLAERMRAGPAPERITALTAGALSAALWERCAADDGWACLRLSEHVKNGGPLPPQSRGDANWLREQACDLQVVYACAPHQW